MKVAMVKENNIKLKNGIKRVGGQMPGQKPYGNMPERTSRNSKENWKNNQTNWNSKQADLGKKDECSFCKKSGHFQRSCPSIKCFFCGQYGHSKKVCTQFLSYNLWRSKKNQNFEFAQNQPDIKNQQFDTKEINYFSEINNKINYLISEWKKKTEERKRMNQDLSIESNYYELAPALRSSTKIGIQRVSELCVAASPTKMPEKLQSTETPKILPKETKPADKIETIVEYSHPAMNDLIKEEESLIKEGEKYIKKETQRRNVIEANRVWKMLREDLLELNYIANENYQRTGLGGWKVIKDKIRTDAEQLMERYPQLHDYNR